MILVWQWWWFETNALYLGVWDGLQSIGSISENFLRGRNLISPALADVGYLDNLSNFPPHFSSWETMKTTMVMKIILCSEEENYVDGSFSEGLSFAFIFARLFGLIWLEKLVLQKGEADFKARKRPLACLIFALQRNAKVEASGVSTCAKIIKIPIFNAAHKCSCWNICVNILVKNVHVKVYELIVVLFWHVFLLCAL